MTLFISVLYTTLVHFAYSLCMWVAHFFRCFYNILLASKKKRKKKEKKRKKKKEKKKVIPKVELDMLVISFCNCCRSPKWRALLAGGGSCIY